MDFEGNKNNIPWRILENLISESMEINMGSLVLVEFSQVHICIPDLNYSEPGNQNI